MIEKIKKNYFIKLRNRIFSTIGPLFFKEKINKLFKLRQERMVFLSFDCDAQTDLNFINSILQVLEVHNIKSNFAIPACFFQNNSQLVKDIINKGHELLNHTFSHPDNFVDLSLADQEREILMAHEEALNKTGYLFRGFRAPHFGWFYYCPQKLETLYRFLQEMGYHYSSTTVLSWYLECRFYSLRSYLTGEEFKEIPLIFNPHRFIESFDSYYYFGQNRREERIDDKIKNQFIKDFYRVINIILKNQIPLNIYFDPQDVARFNLLDLVLNILIEKKFVFYKYSSIDTL